MAKNYHYGHRQRLKARFLNTGLDNLETHTALELLLFYAIPKRDTNEIAHEMLEHFGTIADVFEAPIELLTEIKGIGEHAAILLKLIPQLSRLYAENLLPTEELFDTFEKWAAYFSAKFIGRTEEVFFVAALDDANHLVGCELIQHGSSHEVSVPCTDLIKFTMKRRTNRILIAHNHPHGIAMPSREDKFITTELQQTLGKLGISIVDHIIVGRNGDSISMRQYGIMD